MEPPHSFYDSDVSTNHQSVTLRVRVGFSWLLYLRSEVCLQYHTWKLKVEPFFNREARRLRETIDIWGRACGSRSYGMTVWKSNIRNDRVLAFHRVLCPNRSQRMADDSRPLRFE